MNKEVENISKIRDILIGNNLTEIERNLQKTEGILRQQIQVVENKFNVHLEGTIKLVDEAYDKISARFEGENSQQNISITKLQEEIQQLKSYISKMRDEILREQDSMQKLIENKINQVSNQLRQQSDDLQSSLIERIEELKGSKVERSALAVLLSDFAMKVVEKEDGQKSDSPNSAKKNDV
jgi:hypothetical protein